MVSRPTAVVPGRMGDPSRHTPEEGATLAIAGAVTRLFVAAGTPRAGYDDGTLDRIAGDAERIATMAREAKGRRK